MLLSHSCMYGIRAALLVSLKSDAKKDTYIPIRQLSEELGVSFHFLTKILQVLTNAEIMKSYKGPNGGVRLARPAASLYLIDIVEAVDGPDVFNRCLLGLPSCNDDEPCALHEQWDKVSKQLYTLFKETNLEDLAKDRMKYMFRL